MNYRLLILFSAVSTLACAESPTWDCTFDLVNVGIYGSEGDEPGAIWNVPSQVAFDSDLRVIVLTQNGEPPYVFESNGRFVGRIGTSGEGPKQFSSADLVIVGSADTVYVIDGAAARLVAFSPDLQFTRSSQWLHGPVASGLAVDGALVVNANRPGKESIVRTTVDGELLGSTGSLGDGYRWYHALASNGVKTVWYSSRFFDASLWRWDTGSSDVSESDSFPWFRPYEAIRGPTPDLPPTAELVGMWFDKKGLWVVGRAADPDWIDGIGDRSTVEGQPMYDFDPGAVYDYVIERRDPTTNQVVDSCRLDIGRGLVLVTPRGLAVPTPTDLGFIRLELFEMR